MKISNCRICNSSNLIPFFDLGKQPLANSLRESLDTKLKFFSLNLVFCEECCVVQLDTTVDPKILFQNYVWVTGTSNTAINHATYFHEQIIKKMNSNYDTVIEIASNDGTFLEPFKKSHKKVIGIDPASNISKTANENGIFTINNFFNKQLAQDLVREEKNVDLIFARNVIPHVKEIHSIIDGISILSSNETTVAIEFHYSGTIIEELHYDSIYHEHLFYFTISTIGNLFKSYGLYFFDIIKSPISGGSVILLFSKRQRELSDELKKFIHYENIKGFNKLETWQSFAAKSKMHSLKFREEVFKLSKDRKLLGYGASARSSTLLNYCKINNSKIEYILDMNRLKSNKYTPGSDIKIIHPTNSINLLKERDLILLAWNFKKEIVIYLEKNFFKNTLMIPLPNDIQINEF